jgi:hypothetical protein
VKQLTIRIEAEVEREVRDLARREQISLNKAAVALLRESAAPSSGPHRSALVGNALDHLIGSWSARDERAFLERVEAFERVDESFWK